MTLHVCHYVNFSLASALCWALLTFGLAHVSAEVQASLGAIEADLQHAVDDAQGAVRDAELMADAEQQSNRDASQLSERLTSQSDWSSADFQLDLAGIDRLASQPRMLNAKQTSNRDRSQSEQGKRSPQNIDIDEEVAPFSSSIEPFGREDTAHKLTRDSVQESNGMIDQIERAQGVESTRSVFRALTRLRGGVIGSFDGIAKTHMHNIENHHRKWHNSDRRKFLHENAIRHIVEEEGDIKSWAYPTRQHTGKKKRIGLFAAVYPQHVNVISRRHSRSRAMRHISNRAIELRKQQIRSERHKLRMLERSLHRLEQEAQW
jgi:hypothetical protein